MRFAIYRLSDGLIQNVATCQSAEQLSWADEQGLGVLEIDATVDAFACFVRLSDLTIQPKSQ